MLEGMVEDVVASVVLQVADEGTARLMEAVHEEDMSMVPLAEMPVSISSHSPSSPEEVCGSDGKLNKRGWVRQAQGSSLFHFRAHVPDCIVPC